MEKFRGACILLFLTVLVGCGGNASGTDIWIDVPLNNISLTGVQPVSIEGHAASPVGIAKIEILINGALIETVHGPPSTGNLAQFQVSYTPPGTGTYTVEAIATSNEDEVSNPDYTTFTITDSFATTPTNLPTPTLTETPTPLPTFTEIPAPAELEVNFWADPAEIQAGECTTLHWEVSNALDVVFGGISQGFSGSDSACLCDDATYPLTVTDLNGSTEVFRVTVAVSGECATAVPPTNTPTPIPDTLGPNPPNQLKPVNGVSLSCTADVMLRWEAAADPSGIAEYRIEVQRHPGDNNWQPVSGSPFTGITGLERLLSVECGYTYRWRILAVDGPGNVGNWSNWFAFTVILT